jgi:hypothetical protein
LQSVARRQIEEYLLKLADEVPVRPYDQSQDWVTSEAFDTYISAWHDLIRYYGGSSDTEINWLVLGDYCDFCRLLRQLVCDDKQSEKIRRRALEQLEALETTMDLLLRETVTNQEYAIKRLGGQADSNSE